MISEADVVLLADAQCGGIRQLKFPHSRRHAEDARARGRSQEKFVEGMAAWSVGDTKICVLTAASD